MKYLHTISPNKAKTDIDTFCRIAGFMNVATVARSKSKVAKFIAKLLTVALLPFRLRRGDVLLIQYPYKKFYSLLCRIANMRGAMSITLIHDLGSFRRKKLTPDGEIRRLSHTQCIIAHNPSMREWLVDHGCKIPVVDLNIFDYHSAAPLPHRYAPKTDRTAIAYAGSLGDRKNKFLYHLSPMIPSCSMRIYGKGLEEDKLENHGNITYAGFCPSDEFITDPKAGWGLVWDGDSTEECSGNWGEYLRINNPHKGSFYLRAGLPVIVWSRSAMAPFLLESGVGIAVDHLGELENILPQVTEEEYERMAANVSQMAGRLQRGYFLHSALKKSLDIIDRRTV